jgi:hypothetical protein
LPDPSSGACAAEKSFDDFIRHQFQALIFGYLFIKKKVGAFRRQAEASQRSGKQPLSAYRHLSPDRASNKDFSQLGIENDI